MAKGKKILFIVEAMGGGVFTYIVDLANELVKKNYEIHIAYALRPQTPADYKKYFDKRIHLIEVRNFVRAIHPLKDIKAFFEIKRIAQFIQPDLIHLHSTKAGVLGRIAFNGKNIPVFYTPHGYSFLMQNYKPAKRAFFKLVEYFCSKRNCTIISCSEGEYQKTLHLTDNALFVNNGINIAELDKVLGKTQKTDHSFTVFTLGRICHQKNPVLFNQIAEAMPEVRFLWIGDGELRKDLKAPNITVTGWVERNEALQISADTDVFLLTSLWEGLPISLLEAMYMKKLCVVSDVIGNRDVIQNEKNGFVCRTVEEFKNAIERKDVKELVESAYQDIKKEYNTSVMAVKYSEIYSSITSVKDIPYFEKPLNDNKAKEDYL